MQSIKTLFLGILIGLIPIFVFSQGNSNTSDCYIDSIKSVENVFHKIQSNATFQGGPKYFRNFLIKNINHNIFIAELSNIHSSFSDTAKVKFVISKGAIMSNLQIKGTQNDNFKNEIEKVLKLSSCLWVPGEYSGRKVNGWYQTDIFYLIELINGELKIKIDYKWYPFADNN